MALPLAGIRVLELGQVIAGPAVGLFLAELGADVIAVENPRADVFQRERAALAFLKRNKQSLAIDLQQPAGRALFLDLASRTDVVVENYGPGTLERLGLDYAAVSARNPRVIYCSIKGFLPGPYGQRRAADELAQMMGGLAYMTGLPGRPMRAGASITDLGAATFATMGVLAALVDRDKTGRGQHVSSALFETVVFWMSQHLAGYGLSGRAPEPMSVRGVSDSLGWPIYDVFETADDKLLFLGLINDKHWQAFCAEFALDDLARAPDLQTNEQRLRARTALLTRLAAIMRAAPRADLLMRLERAAVVFAPVHTPTELLEDEHLQATGRLQETEFRGQRFLLPGLPLESSAYRLGLRHQPPPFGADTVACLRAYGFGDEQIEAWLREGVVSDGRERPAS